MLSIFPWLFCECAKFRGSRPIKSLVHLVLSCHCTFVDAKYFLVGISLAQTFFVGISWVQNFFSWVFRGFKISSGGYFVSLKFFLMGILWVQISLVDILRELMNI